MIGDDLDVIMAYLLAVFTFHGCHGVLITTSQLLCLTACCAGTAVHTMLRRNSTLQVIASSTRYIYLRKASVACFL
jgi:hypothetical protein